MENTDRLTDYIALLNIRQKAYHRNLIFAVGLFAMTILMTTATVLFTEWNARTIWLMGIFNVLFTVNLLMAWARREITKEKIDLVSNLSG
jgi:hypothetical protein